MVVLLQKNKTEMSSVDHNVYISTLYEILLCRSVSTGNLWADILNVFVLAWRYLKLRIKDRYFSTPKLEQNISENVPSPDKIKLLAQHPVLLCTCAWIEELRSSDLCKRCDILSLDGVMHGTRRKLTYRHKRLFLNHVIGLHICAPVWKYHDWNLIVCTRAYSCFAATVNTRLHYTCSVIEKI